MDKNFNTEVIRLDTSLDKYHSKQCHQALKMYIHRHSTKCFLKIFSLRIKYDFIPYEIRRFFSIREQNQLEGHSNMQG